MSLYERSEGGAPVATVVKNKTTLKNVVAVMLVVAVAATVFGGFGAVASYSAIVGSDIFKAAARGGGGGGNNGGGGNGGDGKASLKVSLSNEVTNQTVVAGTKNHHFAKLVLDATSLSKDIQIKGVSFNITTNGQANPSEVSNLSLYDVFLSSPTQIGTTNDPDADSSAKTTDGDSALATFNFISPLVITSGSSRILELKGDISSAAIDGIYQVGIQKPPKKSPIKVVDVTTLNDRKVSTSYQYGTGPEMTFTRVGILAFGASLSNPYSGYIPGNTNGVTLAAIDVVAEYEDIAIEKIYFTAEPVNNGGWDQVKAFHVYAGTQLLGSPTVTSTDSTGDKVLLDITNSPYIVPKNGRITLILKADTEIVDHKNNSTGTSLQGLAVLVKASSDVVAKGVQTGSSMNVAIVGQAGGNPQYLVRTYPTISLNDNAGGIIPPGVSTLDLHSFTVNANSASDVGLFSVSYLITSVNASTSNVSLYDVSLQDWGTKIATAVMVDTASNGPSQVATLVLTTDGNVASSTTNNLLPNNSIISAGSSRTYTLRADVECSILNCNNPSNPTGAIVQTQFLGDGSSVGSYPVRATDSVRSFPHYMYEHSILWSDFWMTPILQNASSTAADTDQWINGYLVPEDNGGNLAPTSTGVFWTR